MADQDQKLCDKCHERPATTHIYHGGQAGESRSLCQICLLEDSEVGNLMQRFNEAVRVGHCKYCGAPAETAFGGSFSALGEDHFNLVCRACYDDLAEFARRPENAIPEFPFDDKAAQKRVPEQVAERERRQDEFMRQRVSERKSRDDA